MSAITQTNKNDIKVGDYIIYHYEQEECYGTVLEVKKDKARIEICISMKKSEEPLFEELEVSIEKLAKRFG